jgi:hypothetical protein
MCVICGTLKSRSTKGCHLQNLILQMGWIGLTTKNDFKEVL